LAARAEWERDAEQIYLGGVDLACGYRFPVQAEAGASLSYALQVGGVYPADLDSWLAQVEAATSTALTKVTGETYALQRVQGLRLDIKDVRLDEDTTPVAYSVLALWPGDSPPGETTLFRNDTLAYQATDLLRSLTGGTGLAGVDLRACSEVTTRENRIVAEQPTDQCFLQVEIGELDSGKETFSIEMRPS
jgi:hypothetical protein